MTKPASAKKKRGRPRTGKRPVIATRVHEPLYGKLIGSAAALKLTVSEEIERRLELSYEWEQAFTDTKKMVADAQTTLERGFEAALRDKGYQRVRVDQGVIWAEPGMDISRMNVSIDAAAIVEAMKPELVAALIHALVKLKGPRK